MLEMDRGVATKIINVMKMKLKVKMKLMDA